MLRQMTRKFVSSAASFGAVNHGVTRIETRLPDRIS
jgi:hypothetical protein